MYGTEIKINTDNTWYPRSSTVGDSPQRWCWGKVPSTPHGNHYSRSERKPGRRWDRQEKACSLRGSVECGTSCSKVTTCECGRVMLLMGKSWQWGMWWIKELLEASRRAFNIWSSQQSTRHTCKRLNGSMKYNEIHSNEIHCAYQVVPFQWTKSISANLLPPHG